MSERDPYSKKADYQPSRVADEKGIRPDMPGPNFTGTTGPSPAPRCVNVADAGIDASVLRPNTLADKDAPARVAAGMMTAGQSIHKIEKEKVGNL